MFFLVLLLEMLLSDRDDRDDHTHKHTHKARRKCKVNGGRCDQSHIILLRCTDAGYPTDSLHYSPFSETRATNGPLDLASTDLGFLLGLHFQKG